jgi:5'-nucleotidase
MLPAWANDPGLGDALNLTILHTNDLHGKLTPELAAKIRALKTEDALYVDCGDSTKTGNLAVPLKEDPAWALLESAGCDAGVVGNRESQVLQGAFKGKIAGAKHPLLCGNLRTKRGERPLPGTLILERAGLKIGLVGVMVPMVTERMATRAASAYVWDQSIPVATSLAEELRPQVDCLIALTHIGFAEDTKLAEACPLFDLILGGHTHLKLDSPARIGKVWIMQTGSHGRFVGRYRWSKEEGLIEAELLPLG